jgi:hypothetical protein
LQAFLSKLAEGIIKFWWIFPRGFPRNAWLP